MSKPLTLQSNLGELAAKIAANLPNDERSADADTDKPRDTQFSSEPSPDAKVRKIQEGRNSETSGNAESTHKVFTGRDRVTGRKVRQTTFFRDGLSVGVQTDYLDGANETVSEGMTKDNEYVTVRKDKDGTITDLNRLTADGKTLKPLGADKVNARNWAVYEGKKLIATSLNFSDALAIQDPAQRRKAVQKLADEAAGVLVSDKGHRRAQVADYLAKGAEFDPTASVQFNKEGNFVVSRKAKSGSGRVVDVAVFKEGTRMPGEGSGGRGPGETLAVHTFIINKKGEVFPAGESQNLPTAEYYGNGRMVQWHRVTVLGQDRTGMRIEVQKKTRDDDGHWTEGPREELASWTTYQSPSVLSLIGDAAMHDVPVVSQLLQVGNSAVKGVIGSGYMIGAGISRIADAPEWTSSFIARGWSTWGDVGVSMPWNDRHADSEQRRREAYVNARDSMTAAERAVFEKGLTQDAFEQGWRDRDFKGRGGSAHKVYRELFGDSHKSFDASVGAFGSYSFSNAPSYFLREAATTQSVPGKIGFAALGFTTGAADAFIGGAPLGLLGEGAGLIKGAGNLLKVAAHTYVMAPFLIGAGAGVAQDAPVIARAFDDSSPESRRQAYEAANRLLQSAILLGLTGRNLAKALKSTPRGIQVANSAGTIGEPAMNPYEVLGVEKGAPWATVKRAFRKLAAENHPDNINRRYGGEENVPPDVKAAAEAKSRAASQAYHTLETVLNHNGTPREAARAETGKTKPPTGSSEGNPPVVAPVKAAPVQVQDALPAAARQSQPAKVLPLEPIGQNNAEPVSQVGAPAERRGADMLDASPRLRKDVGIPEGRNARQFMEGTLKPFLNDADWRKVDALLLSNDAGAAERIKSLRAEVAEELKQDGFENMAKLGTAVSRVLKRHGIDTTALLTQGLRRANGSISEAAFSHIQTAFRVLNSTLQLQLVPDNVPVYRSVAKDAVKTNPDGTVSMQPNRHGMSFWGVGIEGQGTAEAYAQGSIVILKTTVGELRRSGVFTVDQSARIRNAFDVHHLPTGAPGTTGRIPIRAKIITSPHSVKMPVQTAPTPQKGPVSPSVTPATGQIDAAARQTQPASTPKKRFLPNARAHNTSEASRRSVTIPAEGSESHGETSIRFLADRGGIGFLARNPKEAVQSFRSEYGAARYEQLEFLFSDSGASRSRVRALRARVAEKARGRYESLDTVRAAVDSVLREEGIDLAAWTGERVRHHEAAGDRWAADKIKMLHRDVLENVLLMQLLPDDVPVYRASGSSHAGKANGEGSSWWGVGEQGIRVAESYAKGNRIVIRTTIGDLRKAGVVVRDEMAVTGNAVEVYHSPSGGTGEWRSVPFKEVSPQNQTLAKAQQAIKPYLNGSNKLIQTEVRKDGLVTFTVRYDKGGGHFGDVKFFYHPRFGLGQRYASEAPEPSPPSAKGAREFNGLEIIPGDNGKVAVRAKEGELVVHGPGHKAPYKPGEAVYLNEGDTVTVGGRSYARINGELRPVPKPLISPRTFLSEGTEGHIYDNCDGTLTKVVKPILGANPGGEQRALAFLQYFGSKLGLAGFFPAFHGRPAPDQVVIGRLPGTDLAKLSPKARQAIPEAAWERFFSDLKTMNDAGVSHNDINAQNILWDGTRLRLIDFAGSQVGMTRTHRPSGLSRDVLMARDLRKQIADGVRNPDPDPDTGSIPRRVRVPEIPFHQAQPSVTSAGSFQ